MAASKVATGMELAGPADAARTAYVKALRESLFPRKRAWFSLEVMLALVLKGHRLHPELIEVTEVFRAARRVLAQHPQALEDIQLVWQEAQRRKRMEVPGPAFRIMQVVQKLGWKWD
eukprot:6403116-Alexandrium_andersonii.AAC.1